MSKTYSELSSQAKNFLAECGKFTIDEHNRFEEDTKISVNEMLGLAARILVEQAKIIQAVADKEDPTL